MYEIIPGILEDNWNEIERKINLVKSFASAIHIDIIDGKFAANTTFIDPLPFKKYTLPQSEQALFFEVHLMVENPIQYLKPFADAGFKRFLGHVESLRQMEDQAEFVAQGQLLGEVGLAVDSQTDLSEIKVALEDLDFAQIMTIENVGKSGLPFLENALEKVETLSSKTSIPISVDGGIKDTTILNAKNKGATRFVVNSFLFSGIPYEQYKALEEKLKS